ncbi:MAG: tripartite tricarboxylate transporter TctB family protein [Oscillospiraceae bacterium]|nr:tripartite tricarboxylate transporter TctB family protein [Oscillospiraceae bacterium]
MGAFALFMFFTMESQVRLPAYDSGAPSPRLLPTIFITGILICSAILIIQSLVFKKENITVFDWEKEKPMLFIITLITLYAIGIIMLGFVVASIIIFAIVLWYCGERKPGIYIFTAAAAIGIYYLFKYVFYISLPDVPFFMGG